MIIQSLKHGVSSQFKSELHQVFQSYILMKDALVASDDEKAKELLNDLSKKTKCCQYEKYKRRCTYVLDEKF